MLFFEETAVWFYCPRLGAWNLCSGEGGMGTHGTQRMDPMDCIGIDAATR